MSLRSLRSLRPFTRSVAVPLVLVLAAGCHHRGSSTSAPSCPPCDVAAGPANATPAPPLAGAPDVASLVARVKPAVVNITTTQEVKVAKVPPFLRDWPFSQFFGSGHDRSSPRAGSPGAKGDDEARLKRQALGSGFIVDARGYVVTNAHVVDNADKVRVRLADERELDAKVKGRDARLDLAVLEVEGAKDLPTVPLGSSERVRVGDYVIAIGNPFGLGNTVTMGIVSAKGRAIGAGPYDDFIQTDASINPGNSGGPLFDTRGEVIGVDTAINPAGRGIGFAIPSDALRDVLPQLVKSGHVARGQLGVEIQPIDESMAKALGLDHPHGALVGDVAPNSPAAKAGLQAGDVIVRIDGHDVPHAQELPRLVARHAPGTHAKVELLRDKSPRTIDVTLGELKDEAAENGPDNATPQDQAPAAPSALGLSLADGPDGVVIRSVHADSPAAGVVQAGDILVEIDKRPVKTAQEARRELATRRTGAVLLRLRRDGVSRFVAIEADQADQKGGAP
jgi:serine protease Do